MKLIIAIAFLFCLSPSVVWAKSDKRHCHKCKEYKIKRHERFPRSLPASGRKIKQYKSRGQAEAGISKKGWHPHFIWDNSSPLPPMR